MLEKVIYTGSGMWALWDLDEYKNVDSYEVWEEHFLEDQDIEKEISKRKFVPINAHTDGSFKFKVKINENLDERENKYIFTKSDEYLFNTNGDVALSGIECVSNFLSDNEGLSFKLDKGLYSVTIYIIDWKQEPGMLDEEGFAKDGALPDIIVHINKTDNVNKEYRTSINTFNNM